MERVPHQNFCNYIPLDQPMSRDEAVESLAMYHGSNTDNVRAAFFNLDQRWNETTTIQFRHGPNNSNAAIVIAGSDEAGNELWYNHINNDDGHP